MEDNEKGKRYTTLDDVVKHVGVDNAPIEVEVLNDVEFLRVRETLSRIGVVKTNAEDGTKMLYQACNILFKQGKYYIVHFKHMFLLDGAFKQTVLSEEDVHRMQYVAYLLETWGMVKRTGRNRGKFVEKAVIRAINYKDREKYVLKQSYNMSSKMKPKQTLTS